MSDTASDAPSAAAPVTPSGTAAPLDGTAVWEAIDGIVHWLDRESTLPREQERLLRLLKLTEEAGEVAQAVIGATGQNPRKGHSHTWDEVHGELCDVILTAMVALRTLTPDARGVFDGHLRRIAARRASQPTEGRGGPGAPTS
ncbi:MazG-like family protein [Streptomyces sioyaensis]|uniref:MazG-like family protein n=1 Tax=Streptomyces sioyaensis TaxID=67364 RepID=UPI003EB88DDE